MIELLKIAFTIILVTVVFIPPINLVFFLALISAGGEFIQVKLGLPSTVWRKYCIWQVISNDFKL